MKQRTLIAVLLLVGLTGAAKAPVQVAAPPGPAATIVYTLANCPDIPLVPEAPKSRSIFEGTGYVEPGIEDPELEFVMKHGRRDVPVHDRRLTGGFETPDDLARAILAAIEADDTRKLHALLITREEWDGIFWPEFPYSRPATNIRSGDAWFLHSGECHDGAAQLVALEGGTRLNLDRIDCVKGRQRYTNFNLYWGLVLVAHRPDGSELRLRNAWIFAECDGTWKVYMYDDKTHAEDLAGYPATR